MNYDDLIEKLEAISIKFETYNEKRTMTTQIVLVIMLNVQ